MTPVKKKVLASSLSSFLFALLIYLVSFTRPFTNEIHLNSFYGLSCCFLIIFAISFFWIFTWWNLDKLQKEPFYAILKVYFSTLIIHSFLILIFTQAFSFTDETLKSDFPEIVSLIKYVLIPLFTLFVVFEFTIFRLPVFDEAVDCLIYGGFAGIGLGSAMCLGELFTLECVSLQYFIQFLVIRLMLCSSVCSLCGLLLDKLRISSKISNLVFTVIILFTVFSLFFIIDSLLETNIRLAQIDSLKFVLPVILCLIVFCITVLFISKTTDHDFQESSKNGLYFFRVYGCILLVMIIINCLFLQRQIDKTVLHYSADKTWSYELPKNLIEVQTEGINSLFRKKSNPEYQKYTCSNFDFFISFNSTDKLSGAFDEEVVIKGWKVLQQEQKGIITYQLQKDKDVVNIQLEQKNQKETFNKERIIKILTKTLRKEASYEE